MLVDYDGRKYQLNLEKVDVDDMEAIEEYTGLPGCSWQDQLIPTDWNGRKLDGLVPVYQIRLNPSTKVVRCLFWLMQRQNGSEPGPIATVKPDYTALVEAIAGAMAAEATERLKKLKEDQGPKAPTGTDDSPSAPDDSTSGPESPSST